MKREEIFDLLEEDVLQEEQNIKTKDKIINIGRTAGMIVKDPIKKDPIIKFPKNN